MNQGLARILPEAKRFFILLLLGWMVFNLGVTVHYIAQDYTPIPVDDYWRVAQFWGQYKAFNLSVLWKQHNEHRIVFPEISFMLDMLLLHGRMYLPIALSGLCCFGVWLVLVWAAYSQNSIRPWAREAALLVAGAIIAWKGCSTVIATPFQIQFTGLQCAAALALAFISLARQTGKAKFLWMTIAAAAVATYTSGNGMLVWPILLVAGICLHLGKKEILVLAAAGGISISIYFIGYQHVANAVGTNIKHPIQLLEFVCVYMGMPISAAKGVSFAVIAGGLNLALMSLCFILSIRRGMVRSPLGVVIYGGYLFTVVSAIAITFGRLDLNDFNFDQAKAVRYLTMPLAGWAFVAVAAVWLVSETSPKDWWFAAALVAAGSFGYFVSKGGVQSWFDGTRADLQNGQIVATMLRNHVFYPVQVRTIFPDPSFVDACLPAIQQDRKFIWSRGDDKWLGQNVDQLQPSNTPTVGKVTRVYPIPGGIELLGWAESTSLTDEHAVLLVSDNNRIVGFGRRPRAGFPFDLSSWDTTDPLAFVAFLSLRDPVHQLAVYVRANSRGLYMPIEGKIHVPDYTQLARQTDSAPLTGIEWQPESARSVDGDKFRARNEAAPGIVYASWTGSTEKIRAITTAPFETPESQCLVLPVLHFLSAYGQSVELQDADMGRVLMSAPMLDGKSVWERWRIPVPGGIKHLRVVARDQGSSRFQWLAVAAPEQCQ